MNSTVRLGVAVLILLAAGACRKAEPTSAVVAKRDVVGYELLGGKLIEPPNARAYVMATYRAPVQRVMATVGARVKRGDVLVELSFPSVQAAYEQAQINLRAAERAYNGTKSSADATVREWKKRVDALRASPQTPPPDESMSTSGDLQAAQDGLAQAIADRDASVPFYKQQLERVRLEAAQAKAGAKLASIRTPISGTVLEINAVAGQEVGVDAHKPIATIVDLSALQVEADLTADQMGIVRRNTPIVLTFKDIANKQFQGKVKSMTPQPTRNGELHEKAIINFENEGGLVKPEMHLDWAAVKTGEVKNVLAVPNGAVTKDSSGKPIVYVLKNGEWVATVVEVGLRGLEYTEIKSGVSEGNTVRVG